MALSPGQREQRVLRISRFLIVVQNAWDAHKSAQGGIISFLQILKKDLIVRFYHIHHIIVLVPI